MVRRIRCERRTWRITRPSACLDRLVSENPTNSNGFIRLELRRGQRVVFERLAALATSSDRLDERLRKLSKVAGAESRLYLDALDEAMVPLESAGLS